MAQTVEEHTKALQNAGKALKRAEKTRERKAAELKEVVEAAVEAGMPIQRVAKAADVQRLTVYRMAGRA